MNYEICYGEAVYYEKAGNPWQACLMALDECLDNNGTFPLVPFYVTNLSDDYTSNEVIGLAEVLNIRNLAAEGKEELNEYQN